MKVLEPGSSGANVPVSEVIIGSGELWLPPKELYELLGVVCQVTEPSEALVRDIDRLLTRHAADFASLFGVKAPNPVDREELKKCSTEGAYLKGFHGKRVISYSIVNEAMLLSDVFQINEFLALDLLTAAENDQENYPGWPRGLIAVHMYYQGRYWLIDSLNTMIRLCPGRTWQSHLHPNIAQLFHRTLNSVFREDMMDRIMVLMESYNTSKQMDLLERNLALGDWRHRRRVKTLLCSIREGLSRIIFCYSVQRELRWVEIMRVLDYLKGNIVPEKSSISKDDVTLIASALLAIEHNLSPPEVNMSLGRSLRKYLKDNSSTFKCLELWDVFKLGYLISAHKIPADTGTASSPEPLSPIAGPHGDSFLVAQHKSRLSEETQLLADEADFEFTRNVFGFLHWEIFSHPHNYMADENTAKVFHGYISDFIIYMPLKLKEMKYRSEEAAKTIFLCQEQGINPAIPDVPEYESFLECVGEFYAHDQYELGSYFFLNDAQYLSLSKLVRSCCLESPSLFLSSMRFLNGITTGNPGAMFDILRQNGHNASLDHFFESILRYLQAFGGGGLLEDGRTAMLNSFSMNPLEIRGICAYLTLVQTVCERLESARIFFTNQKPNWIRTMMQVAKIRVIPREIRAGMLTTCATMIGNEMHSPEVSSTLWDMLYQSRLLDPGTGDVKDELDEMETRLESYSLTVGMLKLINALVSSRFRLVDFVSVEGYGVNATYDNGAIFPYVNYVVDVVFLKTPYRRFKDPSEKWITLRLCAHIISILLDYMPKLMMQLLCDSHLIRTLLNMILHCSVVNDHTNEVGDLGSEHVEVCSLELLTLLWRALQRQPFYLLQRDDLQRSHDTYVLVGIHELIMKTGVETGKPDYLLSLLRFIDILVPADHRLAAIEILALVIESHSEIDQHIYAALQWQQSLASVFRHTMVEILYDNSDMSPLVEELKIAAIQVIRKSVIHAEPNVAFFLLGVDMNKLDFLDGVRTVLHGLLDNAATIPTSFNALQDLLSDPRVSMSTLRYLRYTKFFVPYLTEPGLLRDTSYEGIPYFLKCLAVQVKTEGGLDTATSLVTDCFGRLEETLDSIQLDNLSVEMPDLEFFDVRLVWNAICSCEFYHRELKARLIRVEQLEEMLKEEVSKLEKSTVLRLRKTVHTEAKDIINFARTLNASRESYGRKTLVFDGWRQLVEVIMLTPQIPLRSEFVANVLRMILTKVLATPEGGEYFQKLAAETVLTACAVLATACQDQQTGSMLNIVIKQTCEWINGAAVPTRGVLYAALLYCVGLLQRGSSGDVIMACQNSFPLILDNLSRDCSQAQETSLACRSKMQSLYLMGEIIRCTSNRGLGAASSAIPTLRQDWREEQELEEGASIFDASQTGPGDPNKSFESVCSYDMSFAGGLEKGGIMSSTRVAPPSGGGASSATTSFMTKPNPNFRTAVAPPTASGGATRHVISKGAVTSTIMNCVYNNGFLSTLVDGLCVVDDLELMTLLTNPRNEVAMRSYFVFEAKMSMLTRLAESGLKGVLQLMDLCVVKRLSDMKVFELHTYQSDFSKEELLQGEYEDCEIDIPEEISNCHENHPVKIIYSRNKTAGLNPPPEVVELYRSFSVPGRPSSAPSPKIVKRKNTNNSKSVSNSERSMVESLYTQVFKLFHAMLDSGGKNVTVMEEILQFIRAHDEALSKVLGVRPFVQKSETAMQCAPMLVTLMAKLSPRLMAAPTMIAFPAKSHLRQSLFNILRSQVDGIRVGETSMALIKNTLTYIYYSSLYVETKGPQRGLKTRRTVLTKKLEMDTLLRNPEENISVGVIVKIVSGVAENVLMSQLKEKTTTGEEAPTRPPAIELATAIRRVHLTEKVVLDSVTILELGLSLIYFHLELFLQEMEKSHYQRQEAKQFRENFFKFADGMMVKPVTEACKRLPKSEFIETVLLKIRRLAMGSSTNANVLSSASMIFPGSVSSLTFDH